MTLVWRRGVTSAPSHALLNVTCAKGTGVLGIEGMEERAKESSLLKNRLPT